MNTIYKKEGTFVTRKIAGEVILVPIRSNIGDVDSLFTLNDVAARIWEEINGSKSVSDIYKIILAEYETDKSQIEKDINIFIEQLKDVKVITAL